MAVSVVFYSLAPKPSARGVKSFEAALAGKTSRGRKWYRLEATPETVYQFPDDYDEVAVIDWYYSNLLANREHWVAFRLCGELFSLGNDAVLQHIPGGREALTNALAFHEKGKPGWVVFIGGDGHE